VFENGTGKQRKKNKNHLLHFHYCLLVSRMDDLNMASCTKITFNCLVFSSPLSFVLQNSPYVLLLLSSFSLLNIIISMVVTYMIWSSIQLHPGLKFILKKFKIILFYRFLFKKGCRIQKHGFSKYDNEITTTPTSI
jgi:hypothetical protein